MKFFERVKVEVEREQRELNQFRNITWFRQWWLVRRRLGRC